MLLEVLQRGVPSQALVSIKIGHAVGQCRKRMVIADNVGQYAKCRGLNLRDLAVQFGFPNRRYGRADATYQQPRIEAAGLAREVGLRGYDKPNGNLCQPQLDGSVPSLSVWLVRRPLGFAFAAKQVSGLIHQCKVWRVVENNARPQSRTVWAW